MGRSIDISTRFHSDRIREAIEVQRSETVAKVAQIASFVISIIIVAPRETVSVRDIGFGVLNVAAEEAFRSSESYQCTQLTIQNNSQFSIILTSLFNKLYEKNNRVLHPVLQIPNLKNLF